MPKRAPCLARPYCLAPRFWLIKVVMARAEAGDGEKTEPLDGGVCPAACHCHFPELVDIGLHHHIGQGDDGILETGGQAVSGDLAQHGAVEADPRGMIWYSALVLVRRTRHRKALRN